MREILFRAKRMDNGEWVEGYPVKFQPCASKNECVYGIVPTYASALYIVEINPETLCQYTGLTDKNGQRIWENDVISINTYDYNEPAEDFFGKVVYVDAWGCWCIQQHGEEKAIPLCECEGSYLTERVVEGNIFDNPELLKEDDMLEQKMFGGKGEVGYFESEIDLSTESLTGFKLQEYAQDQIARFADVFKVPKENIKIIKRQEYEENTEE